MNELFTALEECITDNDAACMVHDGHTGHVFCLRRIQEINRIARATLAHAELGQGGRDNSPTANQERKHERNTDTDDSMGSNRS